MRGRRVGAVAATAAGRTGTRRISAVKPARGAVSTEAGDRSGTRAAAAFFCAGAVCGYLLAALSEVKGAGPGLSVQVYAKLSVQVKDRKRQRAGSRSMRSLVVFIFTVAVFGIMPSF